jgi:hypothetical protein
LGFPSAKDERAVQSRAQSGKSGRPDAEVLWDGRTCVAWEVKTHKATTLKNPTLLDVLQKLGDGWSEWAPAMRRDEAVHLAPAYNILVQIQQEMGYKPEDKTTGSVQLDEVSGGVWQSRALRTIYQVRSSSLDVLPGSSTVVQVWHQLLTRRCDHGILSNQHTFLLVHRHGHTLHISPPYQFQTRDDDVLAATLSDLSFFIAHSLMSTLGNHGHTQSGDPSIMPSNIPQGAQDIVGYSPSTPGTPATGTAGTSGGGALTVGVCTPFSYGNLNSLTPEQLWILSFKLADFMVEIALIIPDVQTQ